jgi:electron-transferring-flavoprotein dehydrogenase
MPPIDVLIVGAGPAGLSTAIRLRQRMEAAGRECSVVVLDKAAAPGYHNLSGAIVEPAALDELLPDWRSDRSRFADHVTPIERDELYVLTERRAVRLPPPLVPGAMRHAGDVTLSVSRLAAFLSERAARLGTEVYHGFAARELLVEAAVVRGVRLVDAGLDAEGRPGANYLPGEDVPAAITVLADGSHGVLSSQLASRPASRLAPQLADSELGLDGARDPQVYGLGVKAVVQFAGTNPFGNNRVVHTLGFPTPRGVFGGGFVYSMGPKAAAVGLILGLDWRYGDLDPRVEFQTYLAHPFLARLLAGSSVVATGARTIPEGGYYALGPLHVPGALVVGDAAGFVNEAKLKGVHYAMRSGMCAADAIADTLLAGEPADAAGARYARLLEERGILAELRRARSYRQGFQWGMVPGALISTVGDRLPLHLRMPPDRQGTRPRARLARRPPEHADGAAFLALTGTSHREDEPSHVTLVDPALCTACGEAYEAACTHFCPGEVYRWNGERIVLSPSNCLHCMTCTVKCPSDNIRWRPPEGGEGPRYRQL